MALKSDLNKLRKEMSEMADSFADMAKAMNDNAKAASKITGESSERYKQSFKEAYNLAKELSGFTQEELRHGGSRAKIERKIAKTKQNQFRVLSKIANLQDYLLNASEKEAKAINKSLSYLKDVNNVMDRALEKSDKLVQDFKTIEENNIFKYFSELVSDIPIVNKLLGNMVTASKKYEDAITNKKSKAEAAAEGSLEYLKLASKVIITSALNEAKKAITFIDTSSKSLAANLGISRTKAIGLTQEFGDQSEELQGMAMTYVKIMEANSQLMVLAQVQTTFSKETAASFSVLTKNIGLSADVSEKLRSTSVLTGSSLEDQVKDTMGLVRFNNQKFGIAVSEKVVMQEIANISSNIAMSMSAQGKSLASAVYQAQKLGLSMQQIEKTAGSLLEFESSITNELEAELLIGRDLNLERARLAALNNDMKTVAQEINRQGITASSFKLMNTIQQGSIAKSLGMTASEMGNMFARQATFQKLGVKDIGGISEIIAQMREKGATDKQIQDRIGNKALVEAAKNLTMKEQIRDLIDNLANLVMPALLGVLRALDSLLNFLGADGGRKVGAASTALIAAGGGAKIAGSVRGAAALSRMGGMFSKTSSGASAASKAARPFGPYQAGTKLTKAGVPDMRFAANKKLFGTAASKTGSTAAKTAGNAGRFAKFGGAAMKGLGKLAVPLTLAGIGYDGFMNFTDDNLTGGEAATKTLDQNKMLAAGAVIGTMIAPVIGTAVGAMVGGLADIVMPLVGNYGDEGLAEQKRTNELLQANNKQLMKQTAELYDAISRARSVSIDGDLLTSNAGVSNTTGNRNIL